MGRRNEISRINFKEIAREISVSAMTIYRVLNNEPSVRPATRAKVVEALNRHGYYAHKPSREIRILFDFCEHAYLAHFGTHLMERLGHREFTCAASDHRRNPAKFFDAAAESDAVVYCSIPEDDIIRQVRRLNPELCQIALYTRCEADIVISSDNALGGVMAARHLHDFGHSHIAVHLCDAHPTRFDRYRDFFAEMKLLNPACRIDTVEQRRGEAIEGPFNRYFASLKERPTALFFLTGEYCQSFHLAFGEDERCRGLSVLGYDRARDIIPELPEAAPFDSIEFLPEDILDWTEFYIINRPMMKNRTPVHVNIRPSLKITGSVKRVL